MCAFALLSMCRGRGLGRCGCGSIFFHCFAVAVCAMPSCWLKKCELGGEARGQSLNYVRWVEK